MPESCTCPPRAGRAPWWTASTVPRDRAPRSRTLLRRRHRPARRSCSPRPRDRRPRQYSAAADRQQPAGRRGAPATGHPPTAAMEAWNVYIAVLVAHYPTRASELLAYQRIICDASSHYPASCWLRYDSSFRVCAAADRSIHWDHKHHDLWLQNASPSTLDSVPRSNDKPPRGPCTYCGGLYQIPDDCPQHPFRGAKRSATSPTPIPRHSTGGGRPYAPGAPPLHPHPQPHQPAQPHLAHM